MIAMPRPILSCAEVAVLMGKLSHRPQKMLELK
jgi:hypothetical protein